MERTLLAVVALGWGLAGIGTANAAGYGKLPASGCPALGQFQIDHFQASKPLGSCADSATDAQTGRIARGGAPILAGKPLDGVDCLARSRISLVIDLRSEGERGETEPERRATEAAGMEYAAFPMTTGKDLPSRECADAKLTPAECNERSALAAIDRMDRFLAQNPNGKIYVHCKRGQDRTGLVIGLFRLLKTGCAANRVRREMLDFRYGPFAPLEAVWNKYAH